MIAQPINRRDDTSCGGRLVAADGRVLPLRDAELRADAKAGLARVVLRHTFANVHAEPLVVTYAVPLPHDGVVSGYAFCIGERRIVGEVDRRAAARERFEEAVLEGRSAALLEEERSSLFTQEIGNVPPGAQVVCEIVIDQRLRWLEDGLWEWRFPTAVAPRYLGAPGRVADAERVRQDVAEHGMGVPVSLALTIRDALTNGWPVSPSHAIIAGPQEGECRVVFESEEAHLDRDLVVRWPVARPAIGVTLDSGRGPHGAAHDDTAYGLLTIVPPAAAQTAAPLPRDVIVLLDTSGSMSGEPLTQAREVVAALIGALHDTDRLELIAFAAAAHRWRRRPVAATEGMRREALVWLQGLRAAGGTEMRDGILAALEPLRSEAQRQVVLVTDGLIGFESEVVAAISAALPTQSRVHVVGVGSAVNRTLTASAARAGRGAEVIIGLGENPDEAAQRLLARTTRPVLVELEVGGSAVLDHAPVRLPDVYAGAPALLALRLRPVGGNVRVRGRTASGVWEECLQVGPVDHEGNPAVAALYARERVEDLEMRRATQAQGGDVDAQIERLGLEFQIATRLTSWVAISETPTVDPRQPLRRERLPQALPYGFGVEGLGLRRPQSALPSIARFSWDRMHAPRKLCDLADSATSSNLPMVLTPLRPPLQPAIHGRLVSRRGRELVIEFLLDEAAEKDWQPASDVEIEFAHGPRRAANLDAEHSTRPGMVRPACTVRVTLTLSADPPTRGGRRLMLRAERVVLRTGNQTLVIEVR